jgi:hypothetical protein
MTNLKIQISNDGFASLSRLTQKNIDRLPYFDIWILRFDISHGAWHSPQSMVIAV